MKSHKPLTVLAYDPQVGGDHFVIRSFYSDGRSVILHQGTCATYEEIEGMQDIYGASVVIGSSNFADRAAEQRAKTFERIRRNWMLASLKGASSKTLKLTEVDAFCGGKVSSLNLKITTLVIGGAFMSSYWDCDRMAYAVYGKIKSTLIYEWQTI
jgi:hypothetical protein